MYEIIPNLYLSSYHQLIITSNTFIVNCTKDLDMINQDNIRLEVNDDMSIGAIHTMYSELPKIVDTIEKQLKNAKQVVVHCLAGRQRSATVIAGYLMAKYNYSLQDAITFIKDKKQDAFFSNVNFTQSLQLYETDLRNNRNST